MRRIIFVEGLHNVFFVVAFVGLMFTLIPSAIHYCSTFDFVVLKINTVCEQPLNNRCVNHYIVQEKNGSVTNLTPFQYTFKQNELLVGNALKKDRFVLDYWVNGKKIKWEYPNDLLPVLVISIFTLLWWQYLSRAVAHLT